MKNNREATIWGNKLSWNTSWGSVTELCDATGIGHEKVAELIASGRWNWLLEQYDLRFDIREAENFGREERYELGLRGRTDYAYNDESKATVQKPSIFGRLWKHYDPETRTYMLHVPCTRKFAKQFVDNVGSQRDFGIFNTYRWDETAEMKAFLMGVRFTALKNQANRGLDGDINAPGYCQAYSADPELVQNVQ